MEHLNPGEKLVPGQQITSTDGRFAMTLQTDGNLVLYRGAVALWATGTAGKPVRTAVMQNDGNLVLYEANGHPVWASHTENHPGAIIKVQNDGNAVIYNNGTPLWSSRTFAFNVYGKIRDRYDAMGGAGSWLGLPTSDEMPFAEGGRVTLFQHGAIYWWPDTGAIELGNVVVRYKGMYCFGETDEISASDEPYAIIAVVPVPPAPRSEVITQIYSDVDAGDSRPDAVDLYKGRPDGIGLAVTLWEHDAGSRDAHLDAVKKGVATGGVILTGACGAIGGPAAAVICGGIWGAASSAIVTAVNDLVGSEDDWIATDFVTLTAKQLVTLTRAPRLSFWGIDYHLETRLLSDGEASYKVYLEVSAA